MFAELSIVSSTARLDLLSANRNHRGVGLESYTPARSPMKGGGVWQNSPVSAGRQLAYAQRENAIDTATLYISYPKHSEIVLDERQLEEFIEQTSTYWTTDWQDNPVWLEALAYGDSAKRYALLYNIELLTYPDPYNQPYLTAGGVFVLGPITVGLERSPWQNIQPQAAGEDVAVYGAQHTTSTTSGVHVGNRKATGLTNVYHWDASSTTFSSNLLSASLPYNLFPSPVASGDILYIGSTDPFGNVVFNIGTAANASAWDIAWQYWNGGSWTTLSLTDNVDEFSLTGVRHIRFDIPSAWATTSINGVTVYWIRALTSGVAGQTVPTQTTRQIYTATTSYAEVAEATLDGDIDALALVRLTLPDELGNGILDVGGFYAGLREVDRGSNFTPWLNVLTADNVSGISVTLGSLQAIPPTTTTKIQSSTGTVLSYTATTGDSLGMGSSIAGSLLYFTIDQSLVEAWRGRYRLLVRFTTNAAAGATQLRFWTKFENALFVNRFVGETRTSQSQNASLYPYEILDLGFLQIPPTNLGRAGELFGNVQIGIDGLSSDGETVLINDLFLLPADEWTGETSTLGDTLPSESYAIELDGITYPKQFTRALVRLTSDGRINNTPRFATAGQPILHGGSQQRLWVLLAEFDTNGIPFSRPSMTGVLSLEANERFHFLR